MDVPMELARIMIAEYSEQQVIYLRERDGERTFPIAIGITEAMAIDRRLKGIPFPRPLTHDLLANVIEALGGELEKIVVNDLRQIDDEDSHGTFIATLYIRRNDEVIEVDSRPSDAVALGAGLGTPIYVAEHVLDAATRGPSTREERVEMLRKRMSLLEVQIRRVESRLGDEEFLSEADQELIEQHRRLLEQMQTEHDAIADAIRKHG